MSGTHRHAPAAGADAPPEARAIATGGDLARVVDGPFDDALDAGAIRAALGPAHAVALEVRASVDSTNRVLLEDDDTQVRVLLAERQTAGRGRRGRTWLADPAGSLCLSLAWRSTRPPRETAALGIVAGVACAEVLRTLPGATVGLKWPNDLVIDDRKLGGILVEARADRGGIRAVIGVGVNVRLPASVAATIDADALARDAVAGDASNAAGLPCTDLHAALGAATPSRNRLAALFIGGLLHRLHEFEGQGLAAAVAAWPSLDALAGRRVRVLDGADGRCGIARGIDTDGALRVEFDHGIQRVHSGEVSVRPA